MPIQLHSYRARIELISRESGTHGLRINDEGLMNDVVIVNEATVYRFAKDARAAELLQTELRVLDLLRAHVQLSLPEPFYRSADVMAYPLLPGETLSRMHWLALDESDRAGCGGAARPLPAHATQPADGGRNARQIAAHARAVSPGRLAGHPPSGTGKSLPFAPRSPAAMGGGSVRQRAERRTRVRLPACAHRRRPGSISHPVRSGVATRERHHRFRNCGPWRSCYRLTLITVYGEALVERIAGVYPGLSGLMRRARFYVQAIELQWTLLGLETGETFWFTAHLGGACDIGR
jgi:hypothetical protein